MRGSVGMAAASPSGPVLPVTIYVDNSPGARLLRWFHRHSPARVKQQLVALKQEWFEVREVVLVPAAPRGRIAEHPGAGVTQTGSKFGANLGLRVIRKGE